MVWFQISEKRPTLCSNSSGPLSRSSSLLLVRQSGFTETHTKLKGMERSEVNKQAGNEAKSVGMKWIKKCWKETDVFHEQFITSPLHLHYC